MRKAMSNLKILSAFILLALGLPSVLAQQAALVEPAPTAKLNSQQSEALAAIRKLPSTAEATVVRVNADALETNDRLWVVLGTNNPIPIENNSRESRGSSTTWMGTAPNEASGSTAIIANDRNVTASIQTSEGLYRIRPLGGGLHALIKVDTAKMPAEHPPSSK
jgi:peptidyl-Asp metalloendopeptidase